MPDILQDRINILAVDNSGMVGDNPVDKFQIGVSAQDDSKCMLT
jgi:hypothetical protein